MSKVLINNRNRYPVMLVYHKDEIQLNPMTTITVEAESVSRYIDGELKTPAGVVIVPMPEPVVEETTEEDQTEQTDTDS